MSGSRFAKRSKHARLAAVHPDIQTLVAVYTACAAATYIATLPAQIHYAAACFRVSKELPELCSVCGSVHGHEWYEALLEALTFAGKATVSSIVWPYSFYRIFRSFDD